MFRNMLIMITWCVMLINWCRIQSVMNITRFPEIIYCIWRIRKEQPHCSRNSSLTSLNLCHWTHYLTISINFNLFEEQRLKLPFLNFSFVWHRLCRIVFLLLSWNCWVCEILHKSFRSLSWAHARALSLANLKWNFPFSSDVIRIFSPTNRISQSLQFIISFLWEIPKAPQSLINAGPRSFTNQNTNDIITLKIKVTFISFLLLYL